jgi:hypothetical protein
LNRAASDTRFPAPVIYAIAWHETLSSYPDALPDPETYISPGNRHGICQLNASWPNDWTNPRSNAVYAIQEFLKPAVKYWHGLHWHAGDELLRVVAATYSEGFSFGQYYHRVGPDAHNHYGEQIVRIYKSLITKGTPE